METHKLREIKRRMKNIKYDLWEFQGSENAQNVHNIQKYTTYTK